MVAGVVDASDWIQVSVAAKKRLCSLFYIAESSLSQLRLTACLFLSIVHVDFPAHTQDAPLEGG